MNRPADENAGAKNQMSHDEALRLNAVEMYLLGDLMPEERLRFEDHYFLCQDCAHAVAAGQTFFRAVRPVPEPRWRRFAFPVLAAATAALSAVVGVQNISTIPSLKSELAVLESPQANTVIMAHPFEKGEENAQPVTTDSVTLEMTLPPSSDAPFYRIEIAGEKKFLSQVVPAPSGSRLSLHVIKQALGPGAFNISVYKQSGPASSADPHPEHYYFTIR
ncbi:MAG: zf-HC2 domain-containing protein [Acidobacteriaceae bacterium]|nr:zf-HC2 domain-containing protein [Acidobacteriaceae bacterium]